MRRDVSVRAAEPRDVEAIATIHVAGYEQAHRGLVPDADIDGRTPAIRRRFWRDRLAAYAPREFVVVAEVDGEVAGFASGRPPQPDESKDGDRVGYSENLYLDPRHLGTGVGFRLGLALHDAMLENLRDRGFTEAVSFVVEGNTRALRFFEALGWRRDGTREVEGVRQNRFRRFVDNPRAMGPMHAGPVSRTRAHVEREYGMEKWPAVERLIEAERRAEPDGGLARLLGRVARAQWPQADPLAADSFVVDGELTRMPRSGAYGAARGIVLELLNDVCSEETDLVVELGSGWGWLILSLWAAGGPRRATYVAAEYTEAGRRAATRLAKLDDRLDFVALPFDYHEPALDGLGDREHAVVFTSHSIEQIPEVTPAVFDAIRGVARRVTCVHFEPVGWQVEGHDGKGTSRAYAERQDYNRNLVESLHAEADAGRLLLDATVPDIFGINPANSTTVIVWRSPVKP